LDSKEDEDLITHKKQILSCNMLKSNLEKNRAQPIKIEPEEYLGIDDCRRRFSVTVPRSKNKLAQLEVYEMKITDPSINSIDELRLVVKNRAFGGGVR
jgi:hypothetical protein